MHRRLALLAVPVALVAAVAVQPSVGAEPTQASLPTVSSGARPGPDVLYAPAPDVPQLQNRDPRFRAEPLLVSGTEAYVDGEFLHQDYLFDDYGADTDLMRGSQLSERAGDVEYPDDPDYAGNAADLVEVRIAPGPTDVKYRITLNSLLREDTSIVTLAFDTDRDVVTGSSTLPRDPGAPFPGTDEVVTVWGSGAEHSSLSTAGAPATTAVDVVTDLEANQLTVTVPRSVSDPRGTWRTTVAAGLFDPDTGGWLDVGGPNAIFNLAFRDDEPVQTVNTPPDTNQSIALADNEPTRYARDIDFAALDAGTNSSTVPATGRQIRIMPSRLDLPEGRDLTTFPSYRGRLQPYALYVPTGYRPGTPAGLTLSLHSLGQQYWQYQEGELFDQQGEQRDNLVLSPMAHGPDGWYQDEAEYDVFEAWNDVARRFTLDPDRAYTSGYSMGGYGTYRLAGLYPDLFASAFTVVGPPGEGMWLPPAAPSGGAETLSNTWLENVRHVPFMNLVAVQDELVPIVGPRAQNLGAPELGIRGFEQLGYRYRFLQFPTAEHFTLAFFGYDFPEARDHLGDAVVDRDPAHVTFAYVPASDAPELGLVHDHAYWVSGVDLTDPGGPTTKGVVDARSLAFGLADPEPAPTEPTGGVMALPYVETGQTWLPPAEVPAENALELGLINVRTATLDVDRARLDPAAPLEVRSIADGPTTLVLAGAFPAGSTVTADGEPVPSTLSADAVTFDVQEGARTYVASRPAAGDGGTDGPGGPGAAGPEAAGPGTTGPSTAAGTAPSAQPVATVRRTLPATGVPALLPMLAGLTALAGLALRRRSTAT